MREETRHWSDDDLLRRTYGLAGEDTSAEAHLDQCPECGARWRQLQSRRANAVSLAEAGAVSEERLQRQRAAVWERIERPHAFWLWKWAPAAAAAPANAQPGQGATPAAVVPPPAPKLLHAQHPDRFTPGAGLPQGVPATADQDKKPAPKAGLKPEPKAGLKPASKPEAKTGQKTNPPPAHTEGKTQP